MTPAEIIARKPPGLVCSDCNAPSPEVTDQAMPQCMRCYQVTHTARFLNMQTCSHCSYSYNGDEWDGCPNDDCIVNQTPFRAMQEDGDELIDPEAYFDDLEDEAPEGE